jgi:hypothetical protein
MVLGKIGGIEYSAKDVRCARNALDEIYSHYYFRPKPFENSKLYEFLGVRLAKKAVTYIFKNKGRANNYYIGKERNLEALIKYEKEARFNEKVHLFSAACCIIGNLWPINIANIYLIMIQRYNRARIVNTLKDACNAKRY